MSLIVHPALRMMRLPVAKSARSVGSGNAPTGAANAVLQKHGHRSIIEWIPAAHVCFSSANGFGSECNCGGRWSLEVLKMRWWRCTVDKYRLAIGSFDQRILISVKPIGGSKAAHFAAKVPHTMGKDDVTFPLPRKTASCEYEHHRFILKKKTYDQQYSHMYVSRLRALEPQVRANIPPSSSHVPILPKIIDLAAGDQCVIIGTIFKVLAKKPNILDEFVADEVLVLQEESTCLASDDDQLLLEDESGRVALFGNIRMQELVTGVVVGLQGAMRDDGEGFDVMCVFTPTLPPQLPLPS
ncbi:hypothetical protein DYB36_011851, partial [Aphanomyces astaci]